MDDLLDTATVRPSNPLQDTLSGTAALAPPPRSPIAVSPPQSSRPVGHTPPPNPPNPPNRRQSSTSSHQQANRTWSPSAARHSPSASPSLAAPHRPAPLVHAQSYRQVPSDAELQRFAALCTRLYYEKDANAARQVDSILQKLPAAFRTAYARTMATVRSAFHRDEEIRRRNEVDALLATTQPGAKVKKLLAISPESSSIAAMRSGAAKKHRREGLREFIAANCTAAMPGTHPFFKALFAALWLQALDVRNGGAGSRRVEWVVDVAVFTEAGGNDAWAREAVELLKGVLGMSDRAQEPSETDTMRTSILGSSAASETSSVLGGAPVVVAPVVFEHTSPVGPGQQPDEVRGTGQKKQPPPVPPHRGSGSMRSRTGSDPFLNAHEKTLQQQDSSVDVRDLSPLSLSPLLSPASPSSPSIPLLSATSPTSPNPPHLSPPPAVTSAQYRVLTLPEYVDNPELRALCRLFPPFISSPARIASRFAGPRVSTPAHLEAGLPAPAAVAKVGHGELRIGQAQREAGWRGTWWQRLVLWLRSLFGLL